MHINQCVWKIDGLNQRTNGKEQMFLTEPTEIDVLNLVFVVAFAPAERTFEHSDKCEWEFGSRNFLTKFSF